MEDRMEKRGKVITVSRQMGSGGTYVGYEVAKALGFSYLDREILRRAAGLLKRDEASLEEYEGKSSGFIQNFLRTFSFGAPESCMPPERPVYDRDLFVLESKIIHAIADKQNAVIMGRGGFHVLKDRPNTVHLFIHAPRAYRIERVMKADGTADAGKAEARVEESDRRRGKFIRNMTGTEWTDARNYHLCIDSSTVGLPEGVRMVIGFVKTALG
jgi:cytidylate kinase